MSFSDESDYSDFESDYEYESSSDEDYPREEECHPFPLFNQEPISCPICYEERVEEGCAIILPSCSHSFCVVCFTSYVEAEIARGNADDITCPFISDDGKDGTVGRQCRATVRSDVLREIMSQEAHDRLMKLKDAAFVRKNTDYHHCPTPDCTNIVLCKIVGDDGEGVGGGARICDCFKCGNTSCLTCGASPFHDGKTCEEYREEQRRRKVEREETIERLRMHNQQPLWRVPDRSRADEEAKYEFEIERDNNSNDVRDGDNTAEGTGNALANIKRCRRCGNGVELRDGCLKMKCLCGYRFCYRCGCENAQCNCTPSHHGFTDNRTGMGDFSGLEQAKSYT